MGTRILHINKYLDRRGGAEGYMYAVAELQTAHGATVAFWGMASPGRPPGDGRSGLAPFIELEPPPPGVIPRARAAARTLWSETCRRSLARFLDDFQPDVAHVHNIYHHLSPSILAALRSHGTPVVMTLHDYKLACPSYHFLAGDEICTKCLDGHFRHAVETRCKGSLSSSALVALEARLHRTLHLYDPVDVFISPSRFLGEMIRSAGVYPDRLEQLGFPVDSSAIPVKKQAGGPVVFVGRLSREKGVDVLLDAMARLPDARLVVVGEGPQRQELERHAAEVAGGRVTFTGQVARTEALALLRSATVSAVPSRWLENLPMSVLEAHSSGVPVVVSDLGGLPELVSPEVDGLVVRSGDADALALALRALLDDPDRALELGRAGRRRVESSARPSDHVDRLSAIYRRAAARPR
ncbi:glycosyltransferase [Nocardioides mangrovi]|uniref:Glycosyltransferase n=1 Tax=Nocardioides mangrovi TaxID=2874580 RepID=A0ABS7U7F9_9ACTN|nr:glycosyltransferase [Nocardioides mangrovi]MBZ5736900.1 glycosyltransferase [Nocardioides mangrovi]